MHPDYSKYSINELLEALNTIDESFYPERVKIIREEITRRKSERPKVEKKIESENESREYKAAFIETIYFFKKNAVVLRIITFIFGLSLFLNYLFSLNISVFSYKLALSFPGLKSLEQSWIIAIFTIVVLTINGVFVIGAVGSYFNKKIFNTLIALAWGMMALGIELWLFKWWPTPFFDIPLPFKFSFFSVSFGFKINLITSFFFLWSIIIVPELRKELTSS